MSSQFAVRETAVIDVIPQRWSHESGEAGYARRSVDNAGKFKRIYAFAGLTTIIVGIIITGLFLLSSFRGVSGY
jgi:hypothetical protein